jgi:hypothetical protein
MLDFSTPADKDKFINNVLVYITDPSYKNEAGASIQGNAVSFVQDSLRYDGWKNLGYLSDFEEVLKRAGFKIVAGRNHRGRRCRIVTL